jgi:serine/threonine protein kinase
MSLSQPCPPPYQIEALIRDALSGPDRTILEAHFNQCSNCQRVAQAFADVPPRPRVPGDRWRAMCQLGCGGMGLVYLAWDLRQKHVVAVKVLRPTFADEPSARQRFLREASALLRLKSDHVVRLLTVCDGDFEGHPGPFLVMEHIEGESLQRRVEREGKLPPAEVARIGREILLGLVDAHAADVIHRDINPANVLLEKVTGTVKLIDFGLAHREGETSLTAAGGVAGTPPYMAPEQVRGREPTFRTDLYAVGATMYRLCTGFPPFQPNPDKGVLEQVRDSSPVPIEQRNPNVPPRLAAIIRRLMARDPARRFASAAEAAEMLAVDMNAPVLPTETLLLPDPGPRRLRRRVVAALAIAAALLLFGIGHIIREWRKPKVLYVVANSFWWDDYHLPRQQLEQQGFRVVTASAAHGPAIPHGGGRPVRTALRLKDARPEDYAAVVFCGGGQTVFVENGSAAADARRVIHAVHQRNGCVAAVCSGVEVLGAAQVLKGGRATGNEKIRAKLEDAGVVFLKDEPVVVEGRIVTARSGADAGDFAATIRTLVDGR